MVHYHQPTADRESNGAGQWPDYRRRQWKRAAERVLDAGRIVELIPADSEADRMRGLLLRLARRLASEASR